MPRAQSVVLIVQFIGVTSVSEDYLGSRCAVVQYNICVLCHVCITQSRFFPDRGVWYVL